MSVLPQTSCAYALIVLHRHKKFEVNRTKIKGGCQSETKAAQQNSCIDLTLVSYFNNLAGHDRNFALENYGPKSKCFDHNDKMWEEMNCEQVRQWQHWGSGCYKYHCKNGRLHIEVMNYSFTCFYPRQQIQVSLLAHSWLHTGSLVCPPCEEVCGDEFLKKGEKCRKGVVPPKMYQYHYDSMTCGAPRGMYLYY